LIEQKFFPLSNDIAMLNGKNKRCASHSEKEKMQEPNH